MFIQGKIFYLILFKLELKHERENSNKIKISGI
jgi:hypothetical protein